MKNKSSLSIFALLSVLALTISVSAFKFIDRPLSSKASAPLITEDFFRYTASSFNEGDYETAVNWTFLGTSKPASSPCSIPENKPCVVKVDNAALPAPSATLNTIEKRFAAYLISLTSATTYVQGSNRVYGQP